MESETLRSRVAQLVQKSRKAVRLYSGFERINEGDSGEFTAMQLEQWQSVNQELQRQLALALDNPNHKLLPGQLLSVRDRFHSEWRACETELRQKQRDLVLAAERGDFVRAASLGKALVSLRAREQASQAAHHELQDLVDKTKIGAAVAVPDEPPSAPSKPTPALLPQRKSAKIIPLRR